MFSASRAILCVLVLMFGAYLGARSQESHRKVTIRLVDAATEQPMGGMVRAFADGQSKPLPLPGLYDRLRKLKTTADTEGWYVVPAGGAQTDLPPGDVQFEALSGLETETTRQTIHQRSADRSDVVIKLKSIFRPEALGLAAGNTHLHLNSLSMEESDEYLKQIPAADGLKVLFISYLERAEADKTYITNRYPVGDLDRFGPTGVLYSNGEEHRHNFAGFGQGYGHVMLLGIKELVKPVSIGPGIMKAGTDDPALRPGIDNARSQGGTIIWCHNTNGYEDVPSALAGRLDAINFFDGTGSRNTLYEENYYRFLNVGMKMAISTGTDWFMYDFSRVYAKVDGPLTTQNWLDAVKAGRTVATNGPLLTLRINGAEIGSTVKLDQAGSLHIEATAVGRQDFGELQLIENGYVLTSASAKRDANHYRASMLRDVRAGRPAWFAVRVMTGNKNEFGQRIFAHSSPVYVEVAGSRVFDIEAAQGLLRLIEEAQADIRTHAAFSTPQAGQTVLALYDQAAKDLLNRMNNRK